MPLWRSQKRNVYYVCQRCGRRQPLAKMQWQNGILVCNVTDCIDSMIIGQRDMAVAREVGVDRHELEPDAKLVNPSDRQLTELEVLY